MGSKSRSVFQRSLNQLIAMITQGQEEERPVFMEVLQEDTVTLPEVQFRDPVLIDPLKNALRAVMKLSGPSVGGKEEHILGRRLIRDKGNEAAEPEAGQGESGFLKDLPEQALDGGLALQELPANADPFPLIEVMLFFDAMEHQILAIPFQVAKGRIEQSGHRPSIGCGKSPRIS